MRNHLVFNNFLMAVVITSQSAFAAAELPNPASTAMTATLPIENSVNPLEVAVALRTPTDSTITFKAESDPQKNDSATRQIPHLVLKRNGVLTPGFERTLLVSVDHLSIPKSGLFLDLTIETQHDDPNTGEGNSNKIKVWHEVRFLPYSSEQVRSIDFTILFDQLVRPQKTAIQTPTDYYGYRLSFFDAHGKKLQEIHGEYAFLMENQWMVPLPKVLEASPGAAPDQLVLYYCDMIPFQRDRRDAWSRLERHEVERYLQTELIPAMVQAFEVQTNLWQMPWYPEWTNYRTNEDPKTLSVALNEDKTWYHGTSLYLGNSAISIRVDGTFGEYSTLTEGILSVFHHELFHSQQRNILLHFGGNGNLSGKDNAWKMFSEGTAVLASAVGQPNVEFAPTKQPRRYVQRVKSFLGQVGFVGGGLNESYAEIPYDTALYWRFLYEHCGGLVDGKDDPAAGMQIIRHVLEILYQGKIVEIASSSDAASALPKVVNLALQQTPSCEFYTYQESLLRFSEAVLLLRMPSGRCMPAAEYQDCGLFDPAHLYPTPNAEIYSVASHADMLIQGSIPSSYGIDLVEFRLDAGLNRKSLRVLLETASGTQDELCMQVEPIQTVGNPSHSGGVSSPIERRQSICADGGAVALDIASSGADNISAIGIVITRLDDHEAQDPGKYSLQILSE